MTATKNGGQSRPSKIMGTTKKHYSPLNFVFVLLVVLANQVVRCKVLSPVLSCWGGLTILYVYTAGAQNGQWLDLDLMDF